MTGDDDAKRFMKGFSGLTAKEIKRVIDLVDSDVKFEKAVEQVKAQRKEN
jgi:hypothetical protein